MVDEPTPGAPLDDERLTIQRKLVPMPPLAKPERYSQTLLSWADRCQRGAYLYVRHNGGPPSHQMDRGSAFHVFAAKATAVMVANNERRIPPVLARTLMQETLEEHPEWTIPLSECDGLREMAYHFAMGIEIDPEVVAVVEQKFLLNLDGHVLSGVIDYAELHDGRAVVRDYKTSFYARPRTGGEGYEASFQGRFYACLLMFGQPVSRSGELLPCLGDRLTYVDVGERYPRYLEDDGTMLTRSYGMTRLQCEEVRDDLARMARHLDHSFETGDWPAVPGSHCSMCPVEPACPLPRELRGYGGIQNLEQAQEASEWLDRTEAEVKLLKREIKAFAVENGGFQYGTDLEWAFVPTTTTDTDWAGYNAAQDAGLSARVDEFQRKRVSQRFVSRKVDPQRVADDFAESDD